MTVCALKHNDRVCVIHCMIDYMECSLQSSFRINLVWLTTTKVETVPSSHFLVVCCV